VVQPPEEAKFCPFLQSVQGRVWVSTSVLSAGYRRLFALELCDNTVNLSTHLLILPPLRMNRAVHPLPTFDFLACIGVTFISVITFLIMRLKCYPHTHTPHFVVTLYSLHLTLVAACTGSFSYVRISTRFAFRRFLPRLLHPEDCLTDSGLSKFVSVYLFKFYNSGFTSLV
jgi:hypothetical protein